MTITIPDEAIASAIERAVAELLRDGRMLRAQTETALHSEVRRHTGGVRFAELVHALAEQRVTDALERRGGEEPVNGGRAR